MTPELFIVIWVVLGWTGVFVSYYLEGMYSRTEYWSIIDVIMSLIITIVHGAVAGPFAWLFVIFRKKM